MNSEERNTLLIGEFWALAKKLKKFPEVLAVPRYKQWDGRTLQPVAMEDYTVKCDPDAVIFVRRAIGGDVTLPVMRELLKFRVDDEAKEFHVYLRDTLFT